MSHTPGPWSWWTSNSYRRLTAEGKQDGGVLSAVSASGHADVRVSESDAQLIAAAPDLLGMCVAARNKLQAMEKYHSGAHATGIHALVEKLAVVIGKATGEPA